MFTIRTIFIMTVIVAALLWAFYFAEPNNATLGIAILQTIMAALVFASWRKEGSTPP